MTQRFIIRTIRQASWSKGCDSLQRMASNISLLSCKIELCHLRLIAVWKAWWILLAMILIRTAVTFEDRLAVPRNADTEHVDNEVHSSTRFRIHLHWSLAGPRYLSSKPEISTKADRSCETAGPILNSKACKSLYNERPFLDLRQDHQVVSWQLITPYMAVLLCWICKYYRQETGCNVSHNAWELAVPSGGDCSHVILSTLAVTMFVDGSSTCKWAMSPAKPSTSSKIMPNLSLQRNIDSGAL